VQVATGLSLSGPLEDTTAAALRAEAGALLTVLGSERLPLSYETYRGGSRGLRYVSTSTTTRATGRTLASLRQRGSSGTRLGRHAGAITVGMRRDRSLARSEGAGLPVRVESSVGNRGCRPARSASVPPAGAPGAGVKINDAHCRTPTVSAKGDSMRATSTFAAAALVALSGCSAQERVSHDDSLAGAPAVESSVPTAAAVDTEPFSLVIHCGGREANFDGRDWVASTPLPVLTPGKVSGLSTSIFDVEGTMARVGDDLLRFTVTDEDVVEKGQSVDFVPAAAPPTSRCE
jgi:hypothetical protein